METRLDLNLLDLARELEDLVLDLAGLEGSGWRCSLDRQYIKLEATHPQRQTRPRSRG
jgi:hypothetical protein